MEMCLVCFCETRRHYFMISNRNPMPISLLVRVMVSTTGLSIVYAGRDGLKFEVICQSGLRLCFAT